MALGAIRAAYVVDCDKSFPSFLQLCLQFGIFGVERIGLKLHLPCAVALNAPSHSQVVDLVDSVHLRHFAVTFCTVQFPDYNMLGMIEIGMIGQVVDPDPFDAFACFNGFIYLFYFRRPGVLALPDYIMAVHAKLRGRESGILA
jgi:hypothetical protein